VGVGGGEGGRYVDGGEKKRKKVVYVGGGEKRKEKKKKKINNIIIKTKSKNQNYVPNTIFFLKIVISVVKPKLCTKQNFFYNLEFKSGLKFQLQ
jgi:hypothetical protein